MNNDIYEERSKEDRLTEIELVCKTKLLLLDRMEDILEIPINRGEDIDEETMEQLLWELEFIKIWKQETLGIHELERGNVLRSEHEDIFLLKFTLKGIKPLIWRTVEIPSTCRFSELHEIIQEVFDWSDTHLHLFEAKDKKGQIQMISPSTDPEEDKDEEDYLDERYEFIYNYLSRKTRHLTYVYDMGDNWEVGVELKDTLQSDPDEMYPVVRKGKRAPPPEDSGGPHGYEMLLKALKDRDHPEHQESVEWLEEDFDPEYFDPEDYFWTEKEIIFKGEE